MKIGKKGGYFGLGTGLNIGPCDRIKGPGNYTRFFVRKIGYINFVPKSVRRPSVRLSVRLSVRPSVTFLVIVSSPKPLDLATSNFVGA